jgi:hypothetical protein
VIDPILHDDDMDTPGGVYEELIEQQVDPQKNELEALEPKTARELSSKTKYLIRQGRILEALGTAEAFIKASNFD